MLLSPDSISTLYGNDGLRNTSALSAEHIAPDNATSFVSTGLCDLQINGFAGVDYNNPDALAEESAPDTIAQSLQAMLHTGVTRCLPTIITADYSWQSRCFEVLENARSKSALATSMMAGYHLEGPFLNPAPGYSGCHPAQHMISGDLDYVQRLQEVANGNIKLITVAPEIPGVMAMIKPLVKQSIRVAIGHSEADYPTVQEAIDNGACMSTHLGNGTAPTLAKSDNTILAQLASDRLTASFIADDYHLRRHVLDVYLRAKSGKNTILVTDGTAGSGAAPGRYTLGKLVIERQTEPVVYQPQTKNLAGSATTLDQCVSNIYQWYGVAPATSINWASSNPRQLLGMPATPTVGKPVEWVWWNKTDTKLEAVAVQLGDVYIKT